MASRQIQITVTGEGGNYEAMITRLTDKNSQFTRSATQGAQQTTRAFESLGSSLGLLLKGFIAFQGIAFLNTFSAFAEELNIVSKRTEIVVEDLDALQRVAKLNGSSFQEVGDGLRFLNRAIAESADTGSDAAKIFRALGIDAQGIVKSGGNAKDVMLQLADSFKNNLDVSNRYLAAQKLLGRSSEGLINTLMLGREEIERQVAAQKDLGVVSSLTAQQANEARDKWEQFKQVIQAKIGGPLIDFLSDVIKSMETINDLITRNIALWSLFRSKGAAGALAGGVMQQPGTAGLADILAGAAIGGTTGGRKIDLATSVKSGEQVNKAIDDRTKALEDLQKRVQSMRNDIANPLGDANIKALQDIDELEKKYAKFADPTMRNLIAVLREHIKAKIDENAELERNKAVIEQITQLNKFLVESEEADNAAKVDARAEIEREFQLKQQLLDLDLDRLRALGLTTQADQQQLQNLIDLNEERKKALEIAAEEGRINRQAGDIAVIDKQIQAAKAKLDVFGEHTINIGRTMTNAIGDAFEGIILGTSKLADVGKNLLTAIGRDIIQFFAESVSKKLGFESLIFSNLRGFLPQAQNALMAGAGAIPGGQQGGGGFLSNIFSLFGGGGTAGSGSTGGVSGGGGGGGILGNIFSMGSNVSSLFNSGGFLGGLGSLFQGGSFASSFGFGSAPAGVSGPLMANGGFFSGAGSGLVSSLPMFGGLLGGFLGGRNGNVGTGIMGGIGGSVLGSSLSLMAGGTGGLLATLLPALTPMLSNPITAIIAAIVVAIASIFGSQKPNPTVRVKNDLEGILYDSVNNVFKPGAVGSSGKGTEIDASVVKQVTNEVQQQLEKQAKIWTDLLNLFPQVIRSDMLPALNHANLLLNEMFGQLKFSAGGSRDISEELKDFALRTAPGRFFVATRGVFGAGLSSAFERAGLDLGDLVGTAFGEVPLGGVRNLNKLNLPGLNVPKKQKDMEAFVKALAEFTSFSSALAGISPRGVGQFLTGDDLATLNESIGEVLKITDGSKLAEGVEQMKAKVQPVIDFLQQSIQETADIFGRGLVAALEAATASDAHAVFLNSLSTGVKDMIFKGITQAFIASAQFSDLLAPIQQTIREFTQEAIATGTTPDIAAFRRAIFPRIEDLSTRAETLAPLIDELQKLGLDIKDALNLVTTTTPANIVINIAEFTGSDQDVRSLAQKLDNALRATLNP